MNALVWKNGALELASLWDGADPAPGAGQVLCRTKSVELSAADRALIRGELSAEQFEPEPDVLEQGLIVGRLALAEVEAVGDGVEGIAPGALVSPRFDRPLRGHGFARRQFVCSTDALTSYPCLHESFSGSDPFRMGSFIPIAERLISAHLVGSEAASDRFGIQPMPGASLLFVPGSGRRGEDIIRPSRLTHWILNKALVAGSGTEALTLSLLLATFASGSNDPGDMVEVTAVLLTPDEEAVKLLLDAGISVVSAESLAEISKAIPESRFDAVHLVNVTDEALIRTAWDRLKPPGVLICTNGSPGGALQCISELAEDAKRACVEPLAVLNRHRGYGLAVVLSLDKEYPGLLDQLPRVQFAGVEENAEAVTDAVFEHPWSRVVISFE